MICNKKIIPIKFEGLTPDSGFTDGALFVRELKSYEYSTRFGIWAEHKLFTKYNIYSAVDGIGIAANFKSGSIYNVHFSSKVDFDSMLLSTNIYHTADD